MLAVWTTCKNNNKKNIDNNHYCTKNDEIDMRPNIISKSKEKHLYWKKWDIYKKGVFFCFVFFLLQTESCVCTWDLNQGTRLQNHPGRVKLHRDREELPRSQDRGMKRVCEWKEQNRRVKTTVSHTVNLYSLKPLQCYVMLHHQSGKNNTTTWIYHWILKPLLAIP